MLDLRQFLIDQHDGIPVKGRPQEITMDCPDCGKGNGHFRFNTLKKRGACFRCSLTVGSAVNLLMLLEGISKTRAVELYEVGSIGGSRSSSALKLISKKEKKEEVIVEDRHVNSELPEEFELCFDPNRNPNFICPKVFASRQYKLSTIIKLKIGFCREGSYAARIIFPIECNGMKSFYARKIRDEMKPKYKNPPGSKHSQILYAYDLVPDNADMVFVVEGCTDVCRLLDRGYHAVATSGKKISSEQVDLLVKKKPKEVITMFDSDAMKENEKAFKKLSYRLNASYILLRVKGVDNNGQMIQLDPDEMTEHELKLCIEYRHTMSRKKTALNILKNF